MVLDLLTAAIIFVGLGYGCAHRLLAGHVLAGIKGGNGLLRVEMSGGQQFHGVNVGVVQYVRIVGVDLGSDTPLLDPPFRLGANRVA